MKWIRMEDQLPPTTNAVLAYNDSVGTFVGEHEGEHTFYVVLTDTDPLWIKNCTHWMPLPTHPYHKENVNEKDS